MAPVNDFAEAFSEPQVLARKMLVEMEGPNGEKVKVPGNPIKLSETYADTFTLAPLLGASNQEVFGGLLGKTNAEIAELRNQGAI